MPRTVFRTGATNAVNPALACFVLGLLPGGRGQKDCICTMLSAVSVLGGEVQSAGGAGCTAQEPRLGELLDKAAGRKSF